MRPIRDLPDVYLLEPREILLCKNDADAPGWVLCTWDDAAGKWFVGDRYDLARLEAARALGTWHPMPVMPDPTHFFELPPLPKRPPHMYN